MSALAEQIRRAETAEAKCRALEAALRSPSREGVALEELRRTHTILTEATQRWKKAPVGSSECGSAYIDMCSAEEWFARAAEPIVRDLLAATPVSETPPADADVIAALRGFLACPEIADCAPEDKDPETGALERKTRALITRLEASQPASSGAATLNCRLAAACRYPHCGCPEAAPPRDLAAAPGGDATCPRCGGRYYGVCEVCTDTPSADGALRDTAATEAGHA